ncbi:Uncharacterized conserved protein YbgA, DUF1722 family [Dethiosulfatibacter aminovorans DSM 17477]|uniref:Uncharacterized conserved protein YbgA, DUF1722 family n=1 Tax=Dethiosulfatibacter aminovorans DSM 17477 TaxID=1121476 RepID=A0A1M6ECZ1_9FIRM|nr:DUF523 and DUF1722 domain-containing protein [Dethiosulfatibacter aminovorans]SHI83352.1 Uncharacterized conserved protein YbgA, DUF1722 family [Dethiosulfatibacter aminovorans DSM 17477]
MTEKPVVLISRCIEHDNCRYDGSRISSPFIDKLKNHVEFIDICPEVEIGLSIPREAIRIIRKGGGERLVYSMSGTDITDSMKDFSKDFIEGIKEKGIHGIVMKSRSPSCGIKDVKIYSDLGKANTIPEKTDGFFGRAVKENFPCIPTEDEGRLTNYNIREHFLTRLYANLYFDEVIESNKMSVLVDFHSRNKYLLMAYHQMNQKKLGRIVANHDNLDVDEVIWEYGVMLNEALKKPFRRGTNINMLMHLLGYFKKDLSKEEKAYFLDILQQYSMKKIPFSLPIAVIRSWVVRFDEPYLKRQTIFNPYPLDILDVADSGKGID